MGLNVTHLKVAVLEHLDELSDAAQRIGAITQSSLMDISKLDTIQTISGLRNIIGAFLQSTDKNCSASRRWWTAAAIACAILDSGVERLLIYDQVKKKLTLFVKSHATYSYRHRRD